MKDRAKEEQKQLRAPPICSGVCMHMAPLMAIKQAVGRRRRGVLPYLVVGFLTGDGWGLTYRLGEDPEME